MKTYTDAQVIECLAGDTLPTMSITAEGADISEMSLKVNILPLKAPNLVLKSKEGTPTEDGFTVQLQTSDTRDLDGEYWLDFVLEGEMSLLFKKLRVKLIVKKSGNGG